MCMLSLFSFTYTTSNGRSLHHICKDIHTHAHTHARAHTPTCTHTRTHTHTHIQTNTHTHTLRQPQECSIDEAHSAESTLSAPWTETKRVRFDGIALMAEQLSLWRNRLARSAVNRKVGGSSPPRDESFS